MAALPSPPPAAASSSSNGSRSSSSSSRRRGRQRRSGPPQHTAAAAHGRRWTCCRPLGSVLALVAVLVALQVVVGRAVNIVYDETGWTKREWAKYAVEYALDSAPNPLDELFKARPSLRQALGRARLNSIVGPRERTPANRLASMWAREDGTLVQSPSEDAIDAAAEAVQCSACHSLVSHTWQQAVAAVDAGEPLTEGAMKDMLEEACESQVPNKLLSKYRIVQVEAPEVGVSLFVVRDRPPATTSAADAGPLSPSPAAAAAAAAGAQGKLPGAAAGSSTAAAVAAAADDDSSSSSGQASSPAAAASSKDGPPPRDPGLHPGATAAEAAAAHKACMDLVLHHSSPLQKQLWSKVKDYFAERRVLAQKILTKMQMDEEDPDMYEEEVDEADAAGEAEYSAAAVYSIPNSQLVPAEQLCLDLDVMCAFWATRGQCKANPKYMEGSPKHIGHCRRSCGLCTPNDKWAAHPLAVEELGKSVAAAGALLRNTACTASKACLAGSSTTSGSQAAALADTGNLLPGAVLARTPGFVLGKPSWAVPTVTLDPTGGLPHGQPGAAGKKAGKAGASSTRGKDAYDEDEDEYDDGDEEDYFPPDPADQVLLSEGLGHKLVAIPDNFFMYQLEYKRRVFQFHRDEKSDSVTESHVLGLFDPAATRAAAKRHELAPLSEGGRAWQRQQQLQRDAVKHSGGEAAAGAAPSRPPPMLELLDYLPDKDGMLASWWPFMRQLYTDGEACQVSGRTVDRSVELRAACSPDSHLHLLVREPDFCTYVMVLYHPELCNVSALKPVPVLILGGGSDGGETKQRATAASDGSSSSKTAGSGSSTRGTGSATAAGAKARVLPVVQDSSSAGKGGKDSKGDSAAAQARVTRGGEPQQQGDEASKGGSRPDAAAGGARGSSHEDERERRAGDQEQRQQEQEQRRARGGGGGGLSTS